jgi:hypothetical protein
VHQDVRLTGLQFSIKLPLWVENAGLRYDLIFTRGTLREDLRLSRGGHVTQPSCLSPGNVRLKNQPLEASVPDLLAMGHHLGFPGVG